MSQRRYNPGQNISRLVAIDHFFMFHPPLPPQINVVFLLPTPGMVPVIIQHIPTHSKITTTLILGGRGREGGSPWYVWLCWLCSCMFRAWVLWLIGSKRYLRLFFNFEWNLFFCQKCVYLFPSEIVGPFSRKRKDEMGFTGKLVSRGLDICKDLVIQSLFAFFHSIQIFW